MLNRHGFRAAASNARLMNYFYPCLVDNGVDIDNETRQIVVMMLLSLIPFVTVELVAIIQSPITVLFALIVSVVSLLSYFGYQVPTKNFMHVGIHYIS